MSNKETIEKLFFNVNEQMMTFCHTSPEFDRLLNVANGLFEVLKDIEDEEENQKSEDEEVKEIELYCLKSGQKFSYDFVTPEDEYIITDEREFRDNGGKNEDVWYKCVNIKNGMTHIFCEGTMVKPIS